MRSSDLLYGALAVMAGFGAVVAVAADIGVGVVLVFLLAAAVAAIHMVASAASAPQVLVVGRRDGRPLNLLESELDTAGFAVATCPGPAGRDCPVLRGRACPVHAHPKATIAYMDDRPGAVPPCEKHFRVPTVAVDAGPTIGHPGAAREVSWRDGTRAAVAAVREVAH